MKDNNFEVDVVGSGWGFPLRINGRGGISLASHDRDIEEAINTILATAKGERRMRPDFGCGIHGLVFAPNNSATWSMIIHYVQEALGWWEPRIEVKEVDVRPDTTDMSRLMINIKYTVRTDNNERNLVYPFYLSR
jgi:phage baseplate assembly protein W